MEGEQSNVTVPVESSGSSTGLIIGVIVITAIIILGGLYFWGQRVSNDTTAADQNVGSINMQRTADDTDSIEADLNNTDVDNLDAEMNAS